MGSSSPYDVTESAPPEWKPGEELAASGFVAIVFYLFVDINLGIYRVFKRKHGLYFWCMLLGTWGCVIDSIAIVLKYFLPNSEPLWPLYTTFILLGWSMYAPAQLLLLYSRLHLVNQSRNLQRWVLILIVTVASLMIIPTWPLVWQAFNPYNRHLSSLYSPREAILDRCTQIGFTIAESIVSGIYIWSVAKLLKPKSNVRQRRVMTDLIYVNIIAVSLDVLTVVLVFRNQLGISHPTQTFSYTLKLKLEFMVLNQLMAIAARGLPKENFAERRYHHPSTTDEKDPPGANSKASSWKQKCLPELPEVDSTKDLVLPSPALSRAPESPSDSVLQPWDGHAEGGRWPKTLKFEKSKVKAGDDDTEEEVIGVHMWERSGKLGMEVPWFRTDTGRV
ncbi:MAG: hypothetical protein Q9167_001912 [Letrouitia subvulpina]